MTTSASSPQLPRRRSSLQALKRPGAPQDPSSWFVGGKQKHETKSRSATLQKESARGHSEVDIDLPAPSPAYPSTPVHTSTLHKMGVQESVWLCWRIACRRGSGVSSPSVEDDWPKALLHAAIITLFLTFSSTSPGNRVNVPANIPTRTSSGEVPPSAGRDALTPPSPRGSVSTPLLDLADQSSYWAMQLLFYVPTYLAARAFWYGLPRCRNPHEHIATARLPSALPSSASQSLPNGFLSLLPPPPSTNIDFFCGFPAPLARAQSR
ncbi:hypothetical protein B0H13DRAFT_2395112 [Mycena leptocephala]|nr:hypothetical protein B0H13DRAFT_2395112 [Mycena leptocephala]